MRNRILKLAAVVSSILLAGGYVAYHVTGATGSRPSVKVMAGSKSRQVIAPTSQPTPFSLATTQPAELAAILMSSSKSGAIVTPRDLSLQATTARTILITPPTASSPQQRTVFHGSKSGVIITPSDTKPFDLTGAAPITVEVIKTPATQPTTRFSLEP